jgi:hypothetical protein
MEETNMNSTYFDQTRSQFDGYTKPKQKAAVSFMDAKRADAAAGRLFKGYEAHCKAQAQARRGELK